MTNEKINIDDYIFNTELDTPVCDQLNYEFEMAVSAFLNEKNTTAMNLDREEIQALAEELSQFGIDKEEIYKRFANNFSHIYLHKVQLGMRIPKDNTLERADYLSYLKEIEL